MRTAQVTWDATMAYNAVRALEGRPADAIMVVLIGSGDVAYGLGAERQARQWFDGEIATVVPVAAEEGAEGSDRAGGDGPGVLRRLCLGLPGDEQPLYPSLGASSTAAEGGGRRVIFVPEDGVAARAGLEVGDVIVAIDGTPITDKVAYNRALGSYRWGDAARFTVMRGEQETEVEVVFRRTAEEDDEEAAERWTNRLFFFFFFFFFFFQNPYSSPYFVSRYSMYGSGSRLRPVARVTACPGRSGDRSGIRSPQPAVEGGELGLLHLFLDLRVRRLGRPVELDREHVADGVAREVAERAARPVDVLERAFGVVHRHDPEELLHLRRPDRRHVGHGEGVVQQPGFDLERRKMCRL